MLLVLAAELVEPRYELRQGPLALDQPLGDLAMQLLGRFHRLGSFPPLLLQVVGPGAERDDLAAVAFDLLVEVVAAVALVLDRRFLGGDPLAIGGNLGLAAADLFVDLGGGRPRPATWASLVSAAAKAASRWAVRSRISPSTSASRSLNRRQSTRPTCVRSSCSRSVCSLYRRALPAWARTPRRRLSTSSTMSDNRSRFWSTRSSRRRASSFLSLKRLMPAASSKIMRRSLAEDCKSTSTLPCSITL